MCSIMGYFGEVISMKDFHEGFAKTVSRGPDSSRIIELNGGVLGFHRLAIMGLQPEGMQPFSFEGKYVVCNGEIYGFRTIKEELIQKGYSFKSESDCEILLPLFKEYGVEMFRRLDAEYALIIYDENEKSVIAARDPIGIRPLYYGYDSSGQIAFSIEPKNLVKFVE